MKDYLYLGSSPIDEDCIQVTDKEDYIPKMKDELNRYKKLLMQKFPIPESLKDSTYYHILWEKHDFGKIW